jgi:hypothetical protein
MCRPSNLYLLVYEYNMQDSVILLKKYYQIMIFWGNTLLYKQLITVLYNVI